MMRRYNEEKRLRVRLHVFNVPELCKLMSKACGKDADHVVYFKKLAEGRFNRVFRAILTDGSETIARLPYPATIPKGLGIASEVASMAFLQTHNIPVSKVHDCSRPADNSVGSEHVIMEKVPVRVWTRLGIP
jgi:hypothetical protein